MGIDIVTIRKVMRAVCVIRGCAYPDPVLRYFEYYGLDFADEGCERCEHIFGTFESNGNTLAAHIFTPSEYKATVFVLHGYLVALFPVFADAGCSLPIHGSTQIPRSEVYCPSVSISIKK